MAKHKKKSNRLVTGQPASPSASSVRLRRIAGEDAWELVHPRCARDRADDLEEVEKMIAGGEVEVAIDELRWLLNGCSDFIDAHKLLGELALSDHDLPLARGHFGYAYRLGQLAIGRAKPTGGVPYRLPANRSFFEAGKGLAWCLLQLGKGNMVAEVVELLLKCDPSDPLGLRTLM